MQYKKNISYLKNVLILPFIWAPFPVLVLLDLVIELYHRVVFPIYGMPYIKRSHYIRVDRHRLKYLLTLEKISCMYCGYSNGLLLYVSRIAAETENYWCGIKHEKNKELNSSPYHENFKFINYGDEKTYDSLGKK